ncbi:hypothetical protein TCAL_10816 [Tigriopus californicus]|uniref:SET domain-containing protein n=1 Tax=Tigriopus californicus TaxID=6832 RepID=A0A553NDC3_TIGCA|nr:uncharacterized protein LOC131888582 [Tigriopus californicus]TRY63349.1 hypothetical protein TCAL_10816 [Tigriopus californicus]|eukprot:TCALIF_10816-PA protein Name:"Similar to SETD7 Histone-lysine N-methyltransferase SETD7 (Homo sapiens)" AED:0.21 eAED:0.23 QI:0/-1/0/1/-1/1/1/0/715
MSGLTSSALANLNDRLSFPQIWVESVCESSEDEEELDVDSRGWNSFIYQASNPKDITVLAQQLPIHPNKVIQSLLASCSTDVSYESSRASSKDNSRHNSFQLSSRSSREGSLEELLNQNPQHVFDSEFEIERLTNQGYYSSAEQASSSLEDPLSQAKNKGQLKDGEGKEGPKQRGEENPVDLGLLVKTLDSKGSPSLETLEYDSHAFIDKQQRHNQGHSTHHGQTKMEDQSKIFEQDGDFLTPVGRSVKDWLNQLHLCGFPYDIISKYRRDDIDEMEDDIWFQDGLFRVFDPYYDISSDDIESVDGKTDQQGMPKGNCMVKLTNGDELLATFRNGFRQGRGSVEGTNLLKHGLIWLRGSYKDSVLMGAGVAVLEEHTLGNLPYRLTLEGNFNDGYLEGPVFGRRPDQNLVFVGQFLKGLPYGVCWLGQDGESWLVGKVDQMGHFTGDNLAYIYPNLKTALLGQFKNGVMLRAQAAQLVALHLNEAHIMEPEMRATKVTPAIRPINQTPNPMQIDSDRAGKNEDSFYSFCPSNSNEVCCNWLLSDPYESETVECLNSAVDGAGDGLFARTNLPQGTLVAFYNGLVIGLEESYANSNMNYQIYVDWANTDSSSFVDIPLACIDKNMYCASYAHKANHSFKPNCTYAAVRHPRFGRIPALCTLRAIQKGEELFSHYKYDMALAPCWYQEAWETTSSSPSSSQGNPTELTNNLDTHPSQ